MLTFYINTHVLCAQKGHLIKIVLLMSTQKLFKVNIDMKANEVYAKKMLAKFLASTDHMSVRI